MLKEIEYSQLNAKQQEIYNFQKLAAVLADYGYNCIKLADDWQGADFLAYHIDGRNTIRVQLKGRIMIDKKYFWERDPHGFSSLRFMVFGRSRYFGKDYRRKH